MCPLFSPVPLIVTALLFFFLFEGGFQKQPEPGKSLAKQLLSGRQVGVGKVGKGLTARGGQ